MLGKDDYELMPKETADLCAASDKMVMELKQPYKSVEQAMSADGKIVQLEILKAPLHNSENEVIGLLGISRDITERKLIEEQLIKSEREKNLILANISDVVSYIDLSFNLIWTNGSF
ncbi:MAG: PAS domain-containing protein [Desulfomicrobium escambiense]|nr:PAS domain-containing protein [Desulfomicrobium escambiense]